jgi:transposase
MLNMARVGRPTDYEDSFPVQVRRLVGTGASWRQIADYFGVAVSTIQRWVQVHPEFEAAIRATKDEADLAVENALFQRATGYTADAVKILAYEGVPIEVEYQEHVPPDVNAIKLWLTNRKPKDWKDRQTVSGDPDNPLVHEVRGMRAVREELYGEAAKS